MTICASCGRDFEAASDSEHLCPQCAAESQHSAPALAAPAPSRFRRSLESPTVVLVALNTLVYLIMAIEGHNFLNFDVNLLQSWGANSGASTSGGQWWRLITSTFEHGGLMHLALNMWCLYNLGWLAELLFGRSRFTVLYLLCGIGGSLASICWRGNGLSVGASGAIFGIAGALIPAMLLSSNHKVRMALKGQLISIMLFVAYSLWAGAASQVTDNAAHVGGLLTGLVLGAAYPSGISLRERMGRARVWAGTLFVLLAFACAAVFAVRHNQPYIEIQQAADVEPGLHVGQRAAAQVVQVHRELGIAALAQSANLVLLVETTAVSGDIATAQHFLDAYRKAAGTTPEYIEALSWIGRAQLMHHNYADAEKNAGEVRSLALQQLTRRPLDAEPHLPLALGASIEVQAQAAILCAKGEVVPARTLGQRAVRHLRFPVVQRTGILAELREVAHEDRRKKLRL